MIQKWSFNIELDSDNQNVPLYQQVADKIRHLISSGILKNGDAIPSSRELAEQLGVSRKTIVNAMEQLTYKGILINKERVGLFVAKQKGQEIKEKEERQSDINSPKILKVDDGCPDSMLLPFKEFSRCYRQFFNRAAQFHFLGYRGPQGYEKFRSMVAMILSHSRGLNVEAENICVTRGAQMALFLVANALLQRGDTIVMENPGYKMGEEIFIKAGLNIIKVDVDNSGINVDQLEEICRTHNVKAIYLTPRHQYPTTVPLTQARRGGIVELVKEYGFYVIEDDFGCDFHYTGRMAAPLSCILPSDKFIYIGTFSKIFAPSLRVGYLVSSLSIIDKVVEFRRLIDIQGDNIAERALYDILESGILLRHVRKSIKIYKDKLNYISLKIKDVLAGKVVYKKPSGGLAIWLLLVTNKTEEEIRAQLLQKGLSIHTFTTPAGQVGLRIGYASLSTKEMDVVMKGVSELVL